MSSFEQRKKAWDECLEMWERLSEIPNKSSSIGIKSEVLRDMGITERYLRGCPMCETYYDYDADNLCNECPIQKYIVISIVTSCFGCLKTPYDNYEGKCYDEFVHSQELAKKFYDWLKHCYVYDMIHVDMPKSRLDQEVN